MENIVISLRIMWVVKSIDEETFTFELNDLTSAQAKAQELMLTHQFRSISKDVV